MKSVTIVQHTKEFSLMCNSIAPDKSISHRCAMFSLLSNQPSHIKNFLLGEDTLSSLSIAEQLGAEVQRDGSTMTITPPVKLTEPSDVLDCGNAGTGMRLYAGLLAGIEGSFILTGDKYLRARPMGRVTNPLRDIGATIDGRENGNLAPLSIRGRTLKPFKYHSPIDSAQVKSALILAGLQANRKSYYKENLLSRDHTERMLRGMGADIQTNDSGWIEIEPLSAPLNPLDLTVPADPSSGFFFAVVAAITPNSQTVITNVTLNPTRIEAYKVLENMGAEIAFIQKEDIYEPIGDISIKYNGKLKAVTVKDNIAWLIDELPALSIAMAMAEGTSLVKNAEELRVKESDRISTVLEGLNACGITTVEHDDGYEIIGGTLQSATVNSYGDHRIAMSFAIAGVSCGMNIDDIACIDTSFPNFFDILCEITTVK
ncbi:MAG: 3-phosphoshikimate 1-carboxyvinyltransferase [Sulfurovaceae bacterium]|nr:3-phosphoshikimate 1-carboxyvinyltransferase [Sulfurovaceae bacterium]